MLGSLDDISLVQPIGLWLEDMILNRMTLTDATPGSLMRLFTSGSYLEGVDVVT